MGDKRSAISWTPSLPSRETGRNDEGRTSGWTWSKRRGWDSEETRGDWWLNHTSETSSGGAWSRSGWKDWTGDESRASGVSESAGNDRGEAVSYTHLTLPTIYSV